MVEGEPHHCLPHMRAGPAEARGLQPPAVSSQQILPPYWPSSHHSSTNAVAFPAANSPVHAPVHLPISQLFMHPPITPCPYMNAKYPSMHPCFLDQKVCPWQMHTATMSHSPLCHEAAIHAAMPSCMPLSAVGRGK